MPAPAEEQAAVPNVPDPPFANIDTDADFFHDARSHSVSDGAYETAPDSRIVSIAATA